MCEVDQAGDDGAAAEIDRARRRCRRACGCRRTCRPRRSCRRAPRAPRRRACGIERDDLAVEQDRVGGQLRVGGPRCELVQNQTRCELIRFLRAIGVAVSSINVVAILPTKAGIRPVEEQHFVFAARDSGETPPASILHRPPFDLDELVEAGGGCATFMNAPTPPLPMNGSGLPCARHSYDCRTALIIAANALPDDAASR